MKKFYQYILIFGLLAVLPLAFAQAESTVAVGTSAPKDTDQTDQQVVQKPLSLSVRKQKTESELKSLITTLGNFYTRTQSALDVLGKKDIDISASQEELDLANESLSEAKANLVLFGKVIILENKQEKASSDLKSYAKKIEENLKETRLHLIDTLSLMKEAIKASDEEGNSN